MIQMYKNLFNDYVQENSVSYKVTEDDKGYLVMFSVPGLTKEDLKLSVQDNLMSISFDKKNEDFVFTKPFKKSFILPKEIDEKEINGKVENGILTIEIKKIKKKINEFLINLN